MCRSVASPSLSGGGSDDDVMTWPALSRIERYVDDDDEDGGTGVVLATTSPTGADDVCTGETATLAFLLKANLALGASCVRRWVRRSFTCRKCCSLAK